MVSLMGIHFSSCSSDMFLSEEFKTPIRLTVNCQPQTRGTSEAASQAAAFDAGAKINVTITTSEFWHREWKWHVFYI